MTISGSGGGGAGTTYTAGTGLTLVGSEFNMYGTGALTELSITEALSTATPLTVKGAASHRVLTCTQWQNSAGTTLASITPTTANDSVVMMISGTIVSNPLDASDANAISIGSGARAIEPGAISIGYNAGVRSDGTLNGHGIAIGTNSESCTYGADTTSIAIGNYAKAGKAQCVVIGDYAEGYDARDYATVIGATALGWANSVAIGFTAL